MVTRDQASAYASAVEEILPGCIQIADRFHLYQNLLEAVRNIINRNIPADIKIPRDLASSDPASSPIKDIKKMLEAVDNLSEYNSKSVQLYKNIHECAAAGYSNRETARLLHCSQNTITKYLNGSCKSLCK